MATEITPVVYLACPIDRIADTDRRALTELRDECRVSLDNHGFIFYDPSAAWYVSKADRASGRPLPISIGIGDFAVIDTADALLAIYPDNYATLGVPMEIERALGRGIPVCVVGDNAAARSPLLAGRAPVYNRNQVDLAVRHLRQKLIQHRSGKPPGELKVIGDGKTPTRTYPDDCGLDLYTYCSTGPDDTIGMDYQVGPGQFLDVDCGISIELPPGVWGLITGRSSAIRKKGLLIVNGIIDTGYRGRLFMPVLNVSNIVQFIAHGERIGQLILMQNVTLGYDVRRVDFLSSSSRGEKGRGSSGA